MLAELPDVPPLYKLKCVAPGDSSGFFSSEEFEDICFGRMSNKNRRLLRYIVATAGRNLPRGTLPDVLRYLG
jgi:hypothetical protein